MTSTNIDHNSASQNWNFYFRRQKW